MLFGMVASRSTRLSDEDLVTEWIPANELGGINPLATLAHVLAMVSTNADLRPGKKGAWSYDTAGDREINRLVGVMDRAIAAEPERFPGVRNVRRARAEGAVRPARDEGDELAGRADRRQPQHERARHGPARSARPPARPLAGAPAHRRGVPLPDDASRLRGRQHRLRIPDVRQRGRQLDVPDEHGRPQLRAVRAMAQLPPPALLRGARLERWRARRAPAALRHRPHVRLRDGRPEVHHLPRRRHGRRHPQRRRERRRRRVPPWTSSPATRRSGTRCARRCSSSTRSTRTTRPASAPPTGAATTPPPCASPGSRSRAASRPAPSRVGPARARAGDG